MIDKQQYIDQLLRKVEDVTSQMYDMTATEQTKEAIILVLGAEIHALAQLVNQLVNPFSVFENKEVK